MAVRRKNKTLSATFRQSSTLALLEHNYEISRSLHRARDGTAVDLAAAISGMAVDGPEPGGAAPADGDDSDGEAGGSDADDEEMVEAGSGAGQPGRRRRRGKASEGFKEKVLGVLEVRNRRVCCCCGPAAGSLEGKLKGVHADVRGLACSRLLARWLCPPLRAGT